MKHPQKPRRAVLEREECAGWDGGGEEALQSTITTEQFMLSMYVIRMGSSLLQVPNWFMNRSPTCPVRAEMRVEISTSWTPPGASRWNGVRSNNANALSFIYTIYLPVIATYRFAWAGCQRHNRKVHGSTTVPNKVLHGSISTKFPAAGFLRRDK